MSRALCQHLALCICTKACSVRSQIYLYPHTYRPRHQFKSLNAIFNAHLTSLPSTRELTAAACPSECLLDEFGTFDLLAVTRNVQHSQPYFTTFAQFSILFKLFYFILFSVSVFLLCTANHSPVIMLDITVALVGNKLYALHGSVHKFKHNLCAKVLEEHKKQSVRVCVCVRVVCISCGH